MFEPMVMSPDASPAALPARFQLRPLSTGEVLDRSLSLYRSNFWFCMGLTLVPAVLALLSGLLRIGYLHARHLAPTTNIYTDPVLLLNLVVGSLLGMAAFGFASAGVQWGIGSVYLGRTATLQAAYRVVRPHWFRYAAIAVVQLLTSAWLTLALYGVLFAALFAMRSRSATAAALLVGGCSLLALLSVPYSVYRYLRVSLALPAAVMEGLGIRAALARSRALLSDRKGRIFLLFLLMGALYLVLGTVVGILSLLAIRGAVAMVLAQLATLVTTFAATLLLQPLFNIAICLFYYDERVRREGFDIEFMMHEAASLQAGLPHASTGNE